MKTLNMKAIKLFTISLLIIAVSILAACSENPVSTELSYKSKTETPMSEDNFGTGTFKIKYFMKPGETIFLHWGNTNLIMIKSYSISNCTMNARDLLIRTSNQIGNNSLPCNWKESGSFAFEDLSIRNISGQSKTIEVSLTGLTLETL